ncbi:MAG TPA: hypothetical protein VFA65_11010 [Bryobacteraceae bacterium]|nr:hypothetical protein [Bryobacteraceae bacterium]
MSDLTDIAASTQRFRDAVRAFTPAPLKRYANLMPLREGIVELRENGASLRLIRELPATVGVAVSVATIARFLAEVSHNSASARQRQRFGLHTDSCSEHNPSATCRPLCQRPSGQAANPPQ